MYNGFCRLGIKWQPIESEHMRNYFQLSPDQTGVLVTKVLPLFSCSAVIKRGDVLMAVDEEVIADNGTVRIVVNRCHHSVLLCGAGCQIYSFVQNITSFLQPQGGTPGVRLSSPNPDSINTWM